MTTSTGVPEALLVKEVLHCCQGIDGGRYVWFQGRGRSEGYFGCGPGAEVPPAQQQLISRIAEFGWLLRKVNDLTAQAGLRQSVVHEALIAACKREVNNCYRLIAILEAQSQQTAPHTIAANSVTGQLSLRRLVVWLGEPQARLRIVACCLEATSGLRGGEVINALHAMSKHGDPLVRATVGPLLEEVCIPYFKRIARWVLDGSLDPGSEDDFMIARQALGSDHPAAVWRGAHFLVTAHQPRFMSAELARHILTAGRTVSFLREHCGDSEWAATMATMSAQALDAEQGTYQQLKWLEGAVREVGMTVGRRLLDVVLRRERLREHLSAVKRYVLLGQGDFVRTLVDLAANDLDRSAKDISQFSLQGHVEMALRSCGAANTDAELLQRVRAKLSRSLEGDLGWDVFSISYSVNGPAAAVLGPQAMIAYGRVSRLLWSIKHVDAVTAHAWHHLNGIQRELGVLRMLERQQGIDSAAVVGDAPSLLRYLHARRADMAQFVSSLQAKIVFEVISPAWSRLDSALEEATDVDAVVVAHDEALESITRGTYLDSGSTSSGGRASASDVHAALRSALRSVLDLHGPIRRLAEAIEVAVMEQKAFLAKTRETEAKGQWTDAVYQSPSGVDPELLMEVRSAVWRVYSGFDRHVRTFRSLVPANSQLDLDLGWITGRKDGGD